MDKAEQVTTVAPGNRLNRLHFSMLRHAASALLFRSVAAAAPAQETRKPWRNSRLNGSPEPPPEMNLAARMTKRMGFDPMLARHGQEALAYFEKEPAQFAAVLLDLTMPVLDGARTLTALRAIDPAVKVLVMSGYSEQETATRFGDHPPGGFLQKPFSPHSLRWKLRALFNGKDSAGPPLRI